MPPITWHRPWQVASPSPSYAVCTSGRVARFQPGKGKPAGSRELVIGVVLLLVLCSAEFRLILASG